MKLVRWNPVQDVVSSFARDFDPLFRDGFLSDRWFHFPLSRSMEANWTPLVDLEEREGEVVIHAELPGMKKKDIELAVENGVLTLRGEKKAESASGEGDNCRSERFFGKFERSFTMPVGVVAEKASAEFKDGVLTITLPKKEEAKSRRISIN